MRAGVGVAVLALAVAGCGKDGVTKADVIAQGDAICQKAQADVRALAPPSSGSLDALAPYLEKASNIVDAQAAKLKALPEPSRDLTLLRRFKKAASRDASRYRALSDAAGAGDRAAYTSAAAALRSSTSSPLARRYGLTGCTGLSGAG